ncbi:hypothetical protein ACFL02_05190 [Planctomycetota bacterium]
MNITCLVDTGVLREQVEGAEGINLKDPKESIPYGVGALFLIYAYL